MPWRKREERAGRNQPLVEHEVDPWARHEGGETADELVGGEVDLGGTVAPVLRGFAVGTRGYGYASVPDGETKHDKKERLRAEGFKLIVVPEEARIIQRIYRDFIDGKAVTKIAKDLNDERVPTRKRLKGGWNVSTVSRLLKDEKYTGRFVWNRTTTVKDPLTGKMKQVERPKEEWVVQQRDEMRIISDDDRAAADRRWQEIDGVFPRKNEAEPAPRGAEREVGAGASAPDGADHPHAQEA